MRCLLTRSLPTCCATCLLNATCLLRVVCAPCLLLRCGGRWLRTAVPWKHRFVRQVLLLYAATFLLVLPLTCHGLLNSRFFIKSALTKEQRKSEMQEMNVQRIDDAERYLRGLNRTHLHEMFKTARSNGKERQLDLVISVVTVSRNRHQLDSYKPKYLTQVVSTLLRQTQEVVNAGFPYSLHLEICNVDFEPTTYYEAKSLSNYVPMVQRFNKTHLTLDNQMEKEKKDYVFCLDKAQRLNPRYTLLIEDDALPVDAFFPVLEHTLKTHLDQQYLRGDMRERTERVAYVKLYHPERLLGYVSLEVERIPEWIALALLFSTLFTYLYDRFANINPHVSIHLVQITFLIYFLLALHVVDRSNVMAVRRALAPYLYSYVPAPGCCTPAMLFPADGARVLIRFLSNVSCKAHFGKDIAIQRFILDSRDPTWHAYLVQPSLVSHIGMHSALRQALVNPFLV